MTTRNKALVLVGTRPEAIKLFPVIQALKAREDIVTKVCATAQHREMLDAVLRFAGIAPDHDLDVMRNNQSLDELTARLLAGVGRVLDEERPQRVVVQGDTTTAMAGALAAYYRRCPVSHVEAGLRTGDPYAPWPEEVNRRIVATIADQHFAPTERSAENLRRENIAPDRIYVTGNTVIDALLQTRRAIENNPSLAPLSHDIARKYAGKNIILVTCHRRESFGASMVAIGQALMRLLENPDVAIVLPMHPNPLVRQSLGAALQTHPRAEIIAPQDYEEFVGLMAAAKLVLTDSGGIQEEAPALGKPVLVLRNTTERPEAIEAGTAKLVGTDPDVIVSQAETLLNDEAQYRAMARAHNPFGDGHASDRIVGIISRW